MSNIKPSDLARHLRRRGAQRAATGALRAQALRARPPAAVELLRQRYGADRVLLFGSLAVGGSHGGSDVDLAVSRLKPEQYFSALGELMAVFEAPVDLVDLESAPVSLRERIEAEGEPL
jgi:predicted nucleotidyltransferase